MSNPSSKPKKQTAKKRPSPSPKPPPTPTPKHIIPTQPTLATHIVLPLPVRDAMIRQLGEVPLKFGIEGVVGALRNAPTTTIHSSPKG